MQAATTGGQSNLRGAQLRLACPSLKAKTSSCVRRRKSMPSPGCNPQQFSLTSEEGSALFLFL